MLRRPTTILLLLPAIAIAETCPEITDGTERLACYDHMSTCLDQEDPAARLACIDSWLLPQPATTGEGNVAAPATMGQPAPVATDSGAKAVTEDFGKPKKTKPASQEVTSTIVDLDRDGTRRDYLTLENGQVWRETTNQTDLFEIGQQVTIKAAPFGSYSLRVGDSLRVVKVHRVK